MKSTEFFRRSFDDAPFRRAQLDELRSFKKVEIGMMIAAGSAFLLHTLYFGLTEQKWDSGWGWLVILLFSLLNYVACITRLDALEAIEEKMGTLASGTGPFQPSSSSAASLSAAR